MGQEIMSLEKCTDKQIKELTNCLQRYFPKSSKWKIDEVRTSEIVPLCKNVYTERLKFAEKSIITCEKYKIPLLYPYIVTYKNGNKHIVVPPIVELRGQSLYLGDGMHRVYSLIERNIESVYLMITYDCTLPLPGKPQVWDNIKKQDIQLPGHMNFENFLREGFTGYSKFCNSDIFWKYVGDEKWDMEKS